MRGPNPDGGGAARGRGRVIPEDASAATTTAAAAAILAMPVGRQFQGGGTDHAAAIAGGEARRDGTC
jgi:hypothetical protein